MATIFSSYRRADSASETGRLYDRLVERYGRTQVFKDVDSIPAGVDFSDYIAESIQASDVALVVIGPRWLSASSGFAQRRLDDPADFVRIEIETALRLGVPVIPVLVGGASLPSARRLPESLRPLLRQNGLQLRQDPDFSHDAERIFAAVDHWQAQPRRPSAATPELEATPEPQSVPQPETTTMAEPVSARRAKRTIPGRAPLLVVVSILLVIVLIGAYALSQHPGEASLSTADRQATQTAIAARATQTAEVVSANRPYRPAGIGPCDTDPSHIYHSPDNPYYWGVSGASHVTCQSDGVTALVRGGIAGDVYPTIEFAGLPQYPATGFPANFTLTVDVAFTGADPQGYNSQHCAQFVIDAQQALSAPDVLEFCQDGTFTISPFGKRSNVFHHYNVSAPNHVEIVVQNQKVSMTLNQTPVISGSELTGPFGGVAMGVTSPSSPGDDITISSFVFTPTTQ